MTNIPQFDPRMYRRSSRLLIDEHPLQVLPSLAVAVGLGEAIVLQQIHYWVDIKIKDYARYMDSFQEGRCWVYNTIAEWQEQFPFWSPRTIERTLTSLKARNVVIVKQLAKDTRDRTNWYAIDYDIFDELADCTATKWRDASRQNDVMALRRNDVMQSANVERSYKVSETSPETTRENIQRSPSAQESSLSLSEPEKPLARARQNNPGAFDFVDQRRNRK